MSDPTATPAPAPHTGMETMSSVMLEIPQYYRWMCGQFAAYLGDTVLDVGTGPGVHVPFLGARRLIDADLSEACLAEVRRRFPWVETVRGDAADLAFAELMAGRGIDTYLARDEIRRWLSAAALAELALHHHNGNSWSCLARRRPLA